MPKSRKSSSSKSKASSSRSSSNPQVIDTRSLNWCFTFNNPPSNDEPRKWPDVRYCVWQREEGELETPHLQGYVVFTTRKRLSTLKSIAPTNHWEMRTGDHIQAKTYCCKEDTRKEGPWTIGSEDGIPLGKGARSDLLAVKRAIDEGYSDFRLVDEYFEECARHMRFFREYRRIKSARRRQMPEVIVLWGPTGTGKSHTANELAPDAYWKSRSNWWDGYEGQSDVVIDEFYGWLPYDILLRITDKYPLILETKGGHVNWGVKRIIITSNKHPRDWYDSTKCPYEPLERRISKIDYLFVPYRSQFLDEDLLDVPDINSVQPDVTLVPDDSDVLVPDSQVLDVDSEEENNLYQNEGMLSSPSWCVLHRDTTRLWGTSTSIPGLNSHPINNPPLPSISNLLWDRSPSKGKEKI